MTTLNEADKVRLGNDVVNRIYVGSNLAWIYPPSITGLKLWYDANSLAGADGAAISSWPNLVAGSPALTTFGSPAPVKRINALNDLSVVRLTAGQGWMKQAALTGVDQDHTLLVVARLWGATKLRVLGGELPPVNHLVGWWNNTQDVAYMDGWVVSPGVAATTNWKLYATDGISSYAAGVLADSPIAYYRLNEISGTIAADSSGNNRHSTYSGSPTFGQVAPAGTGLNFDGVNDLVLFPTSVTVPPNSSITIEWWQYVATANVVNSSAMNIGDNSANNFVNTHAPWSDKNLYWDYGNQTNGRIATDYTSRLDNWTLIHLTYDAATGKRAISFNGVEAASRIDANAPTTTRVAGGIVGSQGIKQVDDFAIYLTALTPAQRLARFNSRVPTHRLFSNGSLLGSMSTVGMRGWGNTFSFNQYASEASDSEIAEVLLYDRKLSDTERGLIEAHLRLKWGIT